MTGYFAALHLKATGSAPAIRAKPDSLYGSSPTQDDLAAPAPWQEVEYAAEPGPLDRASGQDTVAGPVSTVAVVARTVAPQAGSHDTRTGEGPSGDDWSAAAMTLQIRALEQRLDRQDHASSAPGEVAPFPLRLSSIPDQGTTLPDQKPVDASRRPASAPVRATRNGEGASKDQPQRPVPDTGQQKSSDVVAAPAVPASVGQAVHAQAAHARAVLVAGQGPAASPVAAPASVSSVVVPGERGAPANLVGSRQDALANNPYPTAPVPSGPVPAMVSDNGRSSNTDQSQISHRPGASIVASRAGEGAGQRPAIRAAISLAPPARQPSPQSGRDTDGVSNSTAHRDEPTTVQVSIGRIEIREQRPPPPAPARRPPAPRLGLREYLDRRLRGASDE